MLREIGGIPPERVDECLARWLDDGLLEAFASSRPPQVGADSKSGSANETAESKMRSGATTPEPSEASFTPTIDAAALDESLDIDLSVQRRILEFESSLELPYHLLLGVKQGAAPKIVKRAYFKLSKEFHPDRYFRKSIGSYATRLDRIFKRVLEAHEILSDPELSQVVIESGPPVPDPPEIERPAEVDPAVQIPGPEATAAPRPKPLTKLERLRQRMPFKINHAAIQGRRARADEIFRAAKASQMAGRFNECEASLRIAITFDPGRAEFKEALGSLRIAAAGARASKLLASPSDRMSDGELREALSLLEDVLPYRPHDPELNERAARVCVQLGKLDEAQEYAETLIERSPESAPGYVLLGRIYKDLGETEKAVGAFEKALKFDGENSEARRSLAAVRIGARDLARGGYS